MKNKNLGVEGHGLVFYRPGKEKKYVFDGLNIHVSKGEIYGLLGPSGCGKTTLLSCVIRELQLQGGEIRIYGRKPGEDGFCIPGRGLGYMPQNIALPVSFSVEEVLWYFGRLFHMNYSQIAERITFLLELLQIPDRGAQIKKLSGGQQRRISFAVALIHKPPLLLLDEPTVGVDPILRQRIWNHLKLIAKEENTTIIITTHYIDEARQADTVGFMKEGILLAEMAPQKLLEQYGVRTLDEVFFKLSVNDIDPRRSTLLESPNELGAIGWISKGQSTERYRPLSDLEQMQLQEFNYPTSAENTGSNNTENTRKNESADSLMNHTDSKSDKWRKKRSRMNTLMKKNVIYSRRNKLSTLFSLLSPALQVMMVCYGIGVNITQLPMAVVNEDVKTGLGRQLVKHFEKMPIKQLYFSDLTTAINSVKKRESLGVIHIERNFTLAVMKRFHKGGDVQNDTIWQSSIKLHLDTTNAQIRILIESTMLLSVQKFGQHILKESNVNPLLARFPVTIEDPVYGIKNASHLHFLVPGYTLGMSTIFAALTIVHEKKNDLFNRTIAAGATVGEILFALLASQFWILMLQIVLLWAVIALVFEIPIPESLPWLFVNSAISGMSGMMLGLLLSSASGMNEMTITILSIFTYVPVLIMGGILWPLEALPYYIQYVCKFSPLALLAESTIALYNRGLFITGHYIWTGPLVSISWTILLFLLSTLIFKN